MKWRLDLDQTSRFSERQTLLFLSQATDARHSKNKGVPLTTIGAASSEMGLQNPSSEDRFSARLSENQDRRDGMAGEKPDLDGPDFCKLNWTGCVLYFGYGWGKGRGGRLQSTVVTNR